MEEAVFGLRLKCRTGVLLQERRADRGTFLPLGKHMTSKSHNINSTMYFLNTCMCYVLEDKKMCYKVQIQRIQTFFKPFLIIFLLIQLFFTCKTNKILSGHINENKIAFFRETLNPKYTQSEQQPVKY